MSHSATTAHTINAKIARVSPKILLSVFGVVPLGVYVVLHLWTNMQSFLGPKAFNTALENSRHYAGFIFLEVFGLALPLVIHAVLGIAEIFRGRLSPSPIRYGYLDYTRFWLQRLAGLGLAAFIIAHVIKARLFPDPQYQTLTGHESWLGMHVGLSEPITFVIYLLGLLGVCYHLANGLHTASMRLGLVVSEGGRRRMTVFSAVVFVVLLAMSTIALSGFKPFQRLTPQEQQDGRLLSHAALVEQPQARA